MFTGLFWLLCCTVFRIKKTIYFFFFDFVKNYFLSFYLNAKKIRIVLKKVLINNDRTGSVDLQYFMYHKTFCYNDVFSYEKYSRESCSEILGKIYSSCLCFIHLGTFFFLERQNSFLQLPRRFNRKGTFLVHVLG